jgi:hypothetical protein
MGEPMVQTIPLGHGTTMTGTDPALKPRLRRRSTFEYLAWAVRTLIGNFVDDGYVIERGDAREILTKPQEPRTQALLEQVL